MKPVPKIRMEPLKELKLHLKLIGISFADSNPKENQLALIKNCVVISYFVAAIMSAGWFRLFYARSNREITESSFPVLITFLYLAWYSALVWQRQNYADILDELAQKIEQSK